MKVGCNEAGFDGRRGEGLPLNSIGLTLYDLRALALYNSQQPLPCLLDTATASMSLPNRGSDAQTLASFDGECALFYYPPQHSGH